jgi:uncharacterized OB-fold protein
MTEGVDLAPVFYGVPQPGAPVELAASYCEQCTRWEFPTRRYCPTCDADPVERPLSGEAVVEFVTAVLHQPPGALIEAPYAVVLARFAEGVSIMGVISDAAYEVIAPGDRVVPIAVQTGTAIGFQFKLSALD